MDTTYEQTIWAFASNNRRRTRKAAIITACSKQAKQAGVRAGMAYEEARQLLPELRVLVYKGADRG